MDTKIKAAQLNIKAKNLAIELLGKDKQELVEMVLVLEERIKAIEEKINKSQFNGLFTKYKEHLDNVISKNDILNRKFYLVIPEKHDINIQIQLCIKKLENIGLKSIQLTNNELERLITKFFTGKSQIYPFKMDNDPSYIKIDDIYNKILYAHGYPRSVESGFLDKIVSSLGDFDLSLHIEGGKIVGNRTNPHNFLNSGKLGPPLRGYPGDTIITTEYGDTYYIFKASGTVHTGLDIAPRTYEGVGRAVLSSDNGIAYSTQAPCNYNIAGGSSMGKGVIVDHQNGIVTLYWHIL